MGFFGRLFGKKQEVKEKKTEVTFELFGKKYSHTFNAPPDVVEEAMRNYSRSFSKEDFEDAWKGRNEIDMVGDDGCVIYERNMTNSYESLMVGFRGSKFYSENGKYCVVYSKFGEDEKNLALVDCSLNKLLYSIRENKPGNCVVNNNGDIACQLHGGKMNIVKVFDVNGNNLVTKRHKYAIQSSLKFTEGKREVRYTIYSGDIKLPY